LANIQDLDHRVSSISREEIIRFLLGYPILSHIPSTQDQTPPKKTWFSKGSKWIKPHFKKHGMGGYNLENQGDGMNLYSAKTLIWMLYH
jgi:hypothetical protein